MVMFKKSQEYIAKPQVIRLLDFHNRKELYVTRPPYQRKVVWSAAKQKALLDSIFRGYYIPRLVLRQVSVGDGVKYEVIDGQQRIAVVQRFFNDEISLPSSLRNVRDDLPGKTYSQLPDDVKAFIDYEQYEVDMVYGIQDPRNVKHQKIATETFRRLREGEALTNMEKANARVNSLVRNFLVKKEGHQTVYYNPTERSGQYLTLSIYLLLRHLKKYYVINDDQKQAICEFIIEFYKKWSNDDRLVWEFDRNSQNNKNAIKRRHEIICKYFFEFADKNGVEFIEKGGTETDTTDEAE